MLHNLVSDLPMQMDPTLNLLSHEDDITAIPPALLKRLDPEFRDFVLSQPAASRTPLHTLSWSSKLRDMVNSSTAGIATPVSVGQVHNISLGQFSVRVLIPEGKPPEKGWPVLLYAHGGGWLFGSGKTGESFYTRACAEIGCVVVSVDYRLAPEHTFPTALDDVWATFLWILDEGAVKYDMNKKCISVCGYSSGANLVASLAQRASMQCPPIPLRAQILLMPILDLTPTHDTTTWSPSMRENAQVFGLWALDVIWSRNMHTPNPEDRVQPNASPLLQQNEKAFKNLPPAWIGVAELDVLRCDGEYYAAKMREQNVPVVLKLYHGATHLTAQADGTCQIARSMRDDQIEALKNAFAV